MKSSELREKSVADLTVELEKLLENQFNDRMLVGAGQLNQTHRLRTSRRDIARVRTILAEKKANETKTS